MSGGELGAALDAVPGLAAWHDRVLGHRESAPRLDHLVASRAGGFLVQEREWSGQFSVEAGTLIRHRMGPSGQWARGAESAGLDAIRRTAEAVETVILRPVEPVLVLTAGLCAFDRPVTVRGVLVMHASAFQEWLDALPVRVDRAEVALTAARMQKAFRAGGAARRTPMWARFEVPHGHDRRRRGPVPVRARPGPRDYTLPALTEPARLACPPAPARRRSIFRTIATSVLVGAMLVTGLRLAAGLGPVPDWLRERSSESPLSALDGTVRLTSCSGLTPAAVSNVLGTRVASHPSSSTTTCSFAASPTDGSAGPADAAQVAAVIAVGSDAAGPVSASLGPMWTLTYPTGSTAPDGSHRVLASPLRISMSSAILAMDAPKGRALAERLARELVLANS